MFPERLPMQTHVQNAYPLVVFKTSTMHGTGGFARRDLPCGTRIIEYVGPHLSKAEVEVGLDQHNVYIFTLLLSTMAVISTGVSSGIWRGFSIIAVIRIAR